MIIVDKIKRRIRSEIVSRLRKKSFYPKIYKSYWHYRLYKPESNKEEFNYFTAVPNPGAGIGHQVANWISGYWFAGQFGLHFAHIPFSNEKWELFFGLGENEKRAETLIQSGYKRVRLPLFNEKNKDEVDLIKNIIESYRDQKAVFVAEQDQFYEDQFTVMDDLKRKFFGASSRRDDKLIFSKEYFNIAIHVRRGDISIGQSNENPNLLMRWLDNNYFVKVLTTVVENIQTTKPIAIYIFSEGAEKDFPEFEKFNNLHFCLDMSAQDSFLHMVHADLLITSKSSFSYKPALFSNGIKVCPRYFWHGYPMQKDWILAEEDGSFNANRLMI